MRYQIRSIEVEDEYTMLRKNGKVQKLTITLEELDEHPIFRTQSQRDVRIPLDGSPTNDAWRAWYGQRIGQVITDEEIQAQADAIKMEALL